MNEELRETVERLKKSKCIPSKETISIYQDDVKIVTDFAEQVLAIEMPEKKSEKWNDYKIPFGQRAFDKALGYNKSIDDCQLFIAKKLMGLENLGFSGEDVNAIKIHF